MYALLFFLFPFVAITQGAPAISNYKEDMETKRNQSTPTNSDYTHDMEMRNQIALECIKQVNIEKGLIIKAVRYPDDLPTDIKYKEFLACSYKKQKFQSDNGKMLYDNIYDFLSRFYERGDLGVLEECATLTADNDAELAYDSLKCIMKRLKIIDKKIKKEKET